MFKFLAIVIIIAGIFVYVKFVPANNKISLPQFPNSLSEVNIGSIKDWSINQIDKYFPDTASQTAVLGTKAKNESLLLVIEAAKRLKPDEFQTLQQFVCN